MYATGTSCEVSAKGCELLAAIEKRRSTGLENRLGRRILRILGLDIQFVIQRPRGDESETAVFNRHGKKTGCGTFGRYAFRRLADLAGIGIDRPEAAMLEIDIVLAHPSRADSPAEARLAVLHANAVVADFFRSDILIMAGPVPRFIPHLVSVMDDAAFVFDECDGQALVMTADPLAARVDFSDFSVVNRLAGFLRPEVKLRGNFSRVRDGLGTGHRPHAHECNY